MLCCLKLLIEEKIATALSCTAATQTTNIRNSCQTATVFSQFKKNTEWNKCLLSKIHVPVKVDGFPVYPACRFDTITCDASQAFTVNGLPTIGNPRHLIST
jgi:hypothetical protein